MSKTPENVVVGAVCGLLFLALPVACWVASHFVTHWVVICGLFLPVILMWIVAACSAPDRFRRACVLLMAAGALSNFTAIAANDWRMPVDPAWIEAPTARHQPITEDTRLVWLTDIFVASSIGDWLLLMGMGGHIGRSLGCGCGGSITRLSRPSMPSWCAVRSRGATSQRHSSTRFKPDESVASPSIKPT